MFDQFEWKIHSRQLKIYEKLTSINCIIILESHVNVVYIQLLQLFYYHLFQLFFGITITVSALYK